MYKKIMAILLCAAIAAATAAGCSGGQTGSSPNTASGAESNLSAPGEFPIVKEPIELEVFCPDATYLSDLNNNQFTKWYEEKTNVKVKYTQVPAASKKEKINLLLTSGEYPDILMSSGLTTADEVTYGTQGIFIPLNSLIEKQGYELKKVFEEQSDILPGAITSTDGKIYGLPNINDAYHTRHMYKAWINTNWLTNLGLKVPTTTDEFYNVLKAFKEKDPNKNGLQDEIPMTGCNKSNAFEFAPYTFLMNSFVYFDSTFLEMNNGKVGFVANTDAYRKGIVYIKKLFDEGLIDATSLTQTEDQFKQLGTNPDAQLVGVGSAALWWKFLGYNIDTADKRADSYDALAPLKGPDGVQYSPITSTAISNSVLLITNKCKNPEVAFKWCDGLYSEEVTERSQFGVEGSNWVKAPEGTLGINKEPAIWKKLKEFVDGPSDESARNTFPGNRTSELRLGEMVDYSDPNAVWSQEPRLYSVTKEKYAPYEKTDKWVPTALYYTTEESSEYARLKEQITTYSLESLVAFLTGNKDIDKEWDSYVKEFDRLELTKYLACIQTAYDRQYS